MIVYRTDNFKNTPFADLFTNIDISTIRTPIKKVNKLIARGK